MTTAVFDTNVLASGFAGFLRPTSTPGALVRAWLANQVELVVSEHIHSELSRTFEEPYFRRQIPAETIAEATDLLRRRATTVPLTVEVRGIATHPEDDLILATAASARADYLVTGDRQLLALGAYRGVTIVSPRQLLDILDAT